MYLLNKRQAWRTRPPWPVLEVCFCTTLSCSALPVYRSSHVWTKGVPPWGGVQYLEQPSSREVHRARVRGMEVMPGRRDTSRWTCQRTGHCCKQAGRNSNRKPFQGWLHAVSLSVCFFSYLVSWGECLLPPIHMLTSPWGEDTRKWGPLGGD